MAAEAKIAEVKIQGLNELTAIIEKYILIVRKKIADALTQAAVEAYVTAKETVPVRTGLLKSSIKLEKISPFEHKITAGWPTKEKGKPYYAPFVEFGTRRMAPRPYMRPAAEKAVRAFIEKLR
ncbi:MAG: HK97 gp10 family phage protein [Nitrososphaerota archaeon]